ncbi:Fer3HCH [Trypoxylus dichotomus]
MSKPSQVRQNFHKDSEDAINAQINLELEASYIYLAMSYFFNREDVALQGHYKYFKKCSDEERGHAMKFMEYMNKRGGRIMLTSIAAPEKQEFENAEEAMEAALTLERHVNEKLLQLHGIASHHNDANLCDFLETHYLQEQVDAIKEIADHVTNLKRVGEGLGVYMFDKNLGDEEA